MKSLSNVADSIRLFWDQKARENPYWYVSSYGAYNARRDMPEFWASGDRVWADIKAAIGYTPSQTHKVVEIGCGVGRLTRAMAKEIGQVVAIDISDEMLDIARRAGLPNVNFCRGDGFSLAPLESTCADLVLAYCVFQHLPSSAALEQYLSEMERVARPGAILAFTLTPRDWRYHLMPLLRVRSYLRERIASAGPKGVYRREWVGIRPSEAAVRRMVSVPLQRVVLHNDKWLFHGTR